MALCSLLGILRIHRMSFCGLIIKQCLLPSDIMVPCPGTTNPHTGECWQGYWEPRKLKKQEPSDWHPKPQVLWAKCGSSPMPQADPAPQSGPAEADHCRDSFVTQYLLSLVSVLNRVPKKTTPKRGGYPSCTYQQAKGQYEGCPPGMRIEMGFGCWLLDHLWGPGRPWREIL